MMKQLAFILSFFIIWHSEIWIIKIPFSTSSGYNSKQQFPNMNIIVYNNNNNDDDNSNDKTTHNGMGTS